MGCWRDNTIVKSVHYSSGGPQFPQLRVPTACDFSSWRSDAFFWTLTALQTNAHTHMDTQVQIMRSKDKKIK